MTTAWVLPGGAALGAVQAGQAQALLERGLGPDLIFGASAGSLNGTWLAHDPTLSGVAALRELWLTVRRREIFPFSPLTLTAGLVGRRDHTVSSGPMTRWLESHVPFQRLEQAGLPLVVTATDLASGQPVYLSRGPLVPALMASSAMPGVFPPVELEGRLLVDGGMAADTPVGVAVEAGADRVYVLPTTGPGTFGRPRGASDVILRSIRVMLGTASAAEIGAWTSRVDIYVVAAPFLPGSSPFSFKHTGLLMEAGRSAAREWLRTARPVKSGAGRAELANAADSP